MGIKFGELARMRHIITYSLSPFEQKAFPDFLTKKPLNAWRRVRGQVFRVVPPFIAAYLICMWAKDAEDRALRKNPADYENDV